MRKLSFLILIVALLIPMGTAFASPEATPPLTTVEICWKKGWKTSCIEIESREWANPSMTITWMGAQPAFFWAVGGEWELEYDGNTYVIPAQSFTVTSNNPNLPFIQELPWHSGLVITMEEGTIGDGFTFTYSDLDPRLEVIVTIGD